MAAPSDRAVSVAGLRKSYDGREVVCGVTFAVDWGECVAILGPNGAGKTTTVEILEGYRRRDAGDVSVCGADPIRGGRTWRAQIGIVLQTTRQHEELTVTELLTEFASYYPSPRPVAEVIELVGLDDASNRRAKRLSGGQQRRLDVGCGLIGRPRVLFLDEPTTGFDPEARRQFWALVSSLHRDGTTILLTTHYLDEAAALADRVVVLAAGRVVADSTPEHLGDRHMGPATVSWSEGGVHRLEATTTPTALVQTLAERFGHEIPDLAVQRPTLEDAYLKLIGEA